MLINNIKTKPIRFACIEFIFNMIHIISRWIVVGRWRRRRYILRRRSDILRVLFVIDSDWRRRAWQHWRVDDVLQLAVVGGDNHWRKLVAKQRRGVKRAVAKQRGGVVNVRRIHLRWRWRGGGRGCRGRCWRLNSGFVVELSSATAVHERIDACLCVVKQKSVVVKQ